MKVIFLAVTSLGMVTTSASAQINTAGVDSKMLPFFERSNNCLKYFDIKAKAKKLSPTLYQAAIQGACVDDIRDMRALYSLHYETSDNQDYLVAQLDRKVIDAKNAMITAYAMK